MRICLTESAGALREKYKRVSALMNEIFYKGFDDYQILAFENKMGTIVENLS